MELYILSIYEFLSIVLTLIPYILHCDISRFVLSLWGMLSLRLTKRLIAIAIVTENEVRPFTIKLFELNFTTMFLYAFFFLF